MVRNSGIAWVTHYMRVALLLCAFGGVWPMHVAASSEGVVALRADYAGHTADCGADCKAHFSAEEIVFIKQTLNKLESLRFEPGTPVFMALGLTSPWYIGRDLIMKCNALLEKQGKRMQIIPGAATCFAYKKADGKYVMEVNISQLITSRVGCVLPVAEMSEATKGMKVYPVGFDVNPGFIVLGHELCHAIHFMDFEGSLPPHFIASGLDEAFVVREGVGSQASYEKRRQGVDSSLWKNRLARRDTLIWLDSEEQVTVLGVPVEKCVPQLSEFFLRLAAGRLPRYAYQHAENCFFEEAETVEHIMYNLLGGGWMDVLRSLPYAAEARFDATVAFDSQYSPWYTPPAASSMGIVLEESKMSPKRAAAMEARRQAMAEKMEARSPPSAKKKSPDKKDGEHSSSR